MNFRCEQNEKLTAGAGATPVRTRIAVYKPWTASMDEGWTEWLLDQYQTFHYTVVTNADMQAATPARASTSC